MIQIQEPTSVDDLTDLHQAYLTSQAAPIDGMWQAFATMARHLEIRSAGKQAGYFCVNDEGQLLQFYITPPFEPIATDLFAAVAARDDVKGAMVSTADSLFLSLCLDIHKEVKAHTYLYQDHDARKPALAETTDASLDVVTASELDAIAELQRDSLDQDMGDWLIGYLENLIARRELYALRAGGEILGTGEARVSDNQPPFADLGVITMRHHRGRGVATGVLRRLKQLCYNRELVPICSTTVENVPSQRAIAKAGFVSHHRILQIGF